MLYGQGGILASPLGCIMGCCYQNGLLALTAPVVNDQTGLPGEGLYTANDYPAIQQRVFGSTGIPCFGLRLMNSRGLVNGRAWKRSESRNKENCNALM